MRIQLASDLHFEFFPDEGQNFIKSMDPSGVDVLLLNGDIIPATLYQRALAVMEPICAKYKRVIAVIGNHELYKSSPEDTFRVFQELENDIPNFTWLENKVVEIEGQRFLGGTMWFKDAPFRPRYAHDMNDFHLIKNFVPWVFEQNARFEAFMEQNLRPGDFVATHHLPTSKLVPSAYKNDPMNMFFVNDMEKLILERKPKLWTCGHTHRAGSVMVGDTRVMCNPKGYPAEWPAGELFDKKLVIEI